MQTTKLFFLFFLICLSFYSLSQSSNAGYWFGYFGNNVLSKKFNVNNELQYRSYSNFGDAHQLLARVGLGCNLTENNNNILLGYAFVNTQFYPHNGTGKRSLDEHRIYQQYLTKQTFGRINITHRYRVEERFLHNDFQMRFRYFLSLNVPINHKTMQAKTFYASAYNEIFLNRQKPIFDRNRLYGGLGYVFNKYYRAEIGFMNQTLENTYRNQFQIAFYNNLPFYKD